MARITSIVYQPEGHDYQGQLSDYMRIPLERATLIAGHGIAGDQKAGRHPDRQLNLLSSEWLQAAGGQGYRSNPGEFGEQIVVEGLTLDELQAGDRLQLGERAVVEIVKPRTGCERLQAAQPLPVKQLGHIGMLARVVQGGEIGAGDAVRMLVKAREQQLQAGD